MGAGDGETLRSKEEEAPRTVQGAGSACAAVGEQEIEGQARLQVADSNLKKIRGDGTNPWER